MCPAWLLVVAVVVGVSRGAASQCWEHPSCQDLSSESNMLECLHLCHSELLTEESPVFPGEAHLLQTPFSSSSSSSSDPADPPASSPLLLLSADPQEDHLQSQRAVRVPARRSYSMEHFRWGKPVGRKRRPVKVYTSVGGTGAALEAPADSSDELGFLPSEMRRELQGNEVLQEEEEEGMLGQEENAGVPPPGRGAAPAPAAPPNAVGPAEQRRDGSYKMSHFRWSGPPASKRYGGFMKSWTDERSQKPLLTLLKNVINKDGTAGPE